MPDSNYRLVKHFTKPEPGEYVPIEYLEITTETVAWSSKLKQSIYTTPNMPYSGELKCIREVNVLSVVNKLSGSISTLEFVEEFVQQIHNYN